LHEKFDESSAQFLAQQSRCTVRVYKLKAYSSDSRRKSQVTVRPNSQQRHYDVRQSYQQI